MAELVKLGVDPSRLEAQGYGDEHPVADNNTEEGRQLNRRISLRVTAK
jgi:K(+)-stimulated pyrophosphate-energized sodium pump